MSERNEPAPGEIAALKAAARKAAFARRKAAHDAGAANAAERAAARFLEALRVSPGEVVAGYRPIRTEIDPTPLMLRLLALGADLCTPVIIGAGQPLEFHRWRPDVAMIEGAFGAMIPCDQPALEPTLLIAPLVAFDREGWRLGYGGGFYDRSLAALDARRPTRAVGFAFAAQELDAVPREPTDRRLDLMITEAGLIAPPRVE